MMKRLLALLAILCLALTGCAANPNPKAETEESEQNAPSSDAVLLGFSQLGWESTWRLANSESIKAAADRAGVSLMYDNAYQVDVIAFSPIIETGWDNVLQEAKDAGIPVLTSDRMISTEDESLWAGFVGSDFYQEGVKAGEFLLKKSEGMGDLNIVELSGTIDSSPMLQRAQGFRDAIADAPQLHLIDSVSGDFLLTKGRECMKELLKKHDRIDVLYSHNDAMTLGAISALEDAGIRPGQDIIIITVDGQQEAVDLLKEGKINCVVECEPQFGDTVMELAKKLAAGEEIPRYTYNEEQVFSEFDTDLDDLPPRGY